MSIILNPGCLGERWDKTPQALAQMRYRGDGPKYFKVGRSVFYRLEDVEAWEESQLRTRTDDVPQEAA
ncbi:hypothetical protein B842_09270 [Corynebacterium humireducens NBRC 106098 = DSM 45392]|uniref:Helix-turn-helix domain-containing protein n=1 Tax=Corynebacterium humireducens NBRC 106098 = DSM 45392 TaxID=1223515 RepID=A0A0B5DC20_9CORY|nr:hypothetical protein [Corynebacterium humireducens]AJE33703.1 hypothetical protein B842_09270 [Corynebacterium humireducens NBRC 106098 = DSM 45392]